jgi:LPPG:FO 2-phospho-L-lactate transferase
MGFESSALGVARWYASWVGTLVIDEADAYLAPVVEAEGVRCVVAPTVMSTVDRSADLCRTVLDAVG